MKVLQRFCNALIGQGPEEPALLTATKIDPDQFHQDNFGKFVYHQFGTGLLGQVLGAQLIEGALEPRMFQ